MSTAKLIDFPNIQTLEDESFDANRPVLIEPGEYEFILKNSKKELSFGKMAKLTLIFAIATEGKYFGQCLSRHYNLKGFTKRKEIIPNGWHSDLAREYIVLFGQPRKLRDICVSKFKGKMIKGRVRTVKKDRKQRDLPKELQYSVIDELISLLTE